MGKSCDNCLYGKRTEENNLCCTYAGYCFTPDGDRTAWTLNKEQQYDELRELSLKLPDTIVTDALVDTSGLPNARYHDRTFLKDYAKKKKAKRHQQKQARRRNK